MIPRVIIQYWDQDETPEDINSLLKSWQDMNPFYGYKCFCFRDAKKFIKEYYSQEVLDAFLKCRLPAMRSDFFRVAYLLEYGGVYIDAGTACWSNIDSLLGDSDKLVVVKKWHGGICNGFVASPPGNPVLSLIFDRIVNNIQSQVSNDIWRVTGPGVFNEVKELCEDRLLKILTQSECQNYFSFVNDLSHKKSNHWSKRQEFESIFASSNSDDGLQNIIKHTNLFHLGPHKTATTSFQNLLESNEDYLKEIGFSLLTVRSSNKEEYKEWRNRYTREIQGYLLGRREKEELIHNISKLFLELKNSYTSEHHKLIVSDENLLGPMTGHPFAKGQGRDWTFYSAYPAVFSSLRSVFFEGDLKVMMCKRKPSEFVTSSYKDMVKKSSHPEDFLSFYEKLLPDFVVRMNELFNSIQDDFEVIDFPKFVKHMPNVFLELMGIDLKSKRKVMVNQSMSWQAIELYRQLACSLKTDEDRKALLSALSTLRGAGSVELNNTLATIKSQLDFMPH
ncbi:hypothetical protein G8770_02760 [Aestuariicella hydrocarbonica]|uniref:Uncharacterized protein n=1 Tax=Pseudomaricurvus hydrocarbonicus TaxID=1470433 RepID=A0A9E5JTA7_9GAMM|nr:glycosyltransferase [Aestuariicella hydrocarbonica]NHO64465.1 hypothetical protein [Aestuariicella hydrocarbonica]